MTLTEQIYAQACLLATELPVEKEEMLRTVCRAAEVSLETKLRSNLSPEDCRDDFTMAASMYAVAAMSELSDMNQLEQITAGDLTLRRSGGTLAANCLRTQADMLMAPYVKKGIAFLGV